MNRFIAVDDVKIFSCFVIVQQLLEFFVGCDKVKGKVKFSLEQAMKAQRGSRGIALLFL